MVTYWISLPASWDLQDVQAVLNVVVTVLSTLGIFTFVRSCWQRGARHITQDRAVPLKALLCVNSLGEVLDTLFFLGPRLITLSYIVVLAQCVVVVILSLTAIVSGPIARYSTQWANVIREQDVPGLLTTRFHNGVNYENMAWNLTHERLDKAGFPLNQLLDYLPDNSIDWIYDDSQWNSSWTLDCQLTPQTSIILEATGNCTGSDFDEIPGLTAIVDQKAYDYVRAYWSAFQTDLIYKDILFFMNGVAQTNYIEADATYKSLSATIAALYLHNVPLSKNTSTTCNFGVGPIETASYTKISCSLERLPSVPDTYRLAFPDINPNYQASLVEALVAYYTARHARESTSDEPITAIPPEELIRFYQTYTVSKDTQYRQPVVRRLNVQLQVVHLSIIFLAFAILTAFLILSGLAYQTLFTLLHFKTMREVPQSKVDWMVQSIHSQGLSPQASVRKRGVLVRPVSGTSSTNLGMRDGFEAAEYGFVDSAPVPASAIAAYRPISTSSTVYGLSPLLGQGQRRTHSQGQGHGQSGALSPQFMKGEKDAKISVAESGISPS